MDNIYCAILWLCYETSKSNLQIILIQGDIVLANGKKVRVYREPSTKMLLQILSSLTKYLYSNFEKN